MANTITESNGTITVIASHTLIGKGRAALIMAAIGGAGIILKDHSPAVVHYDDAAAAGQWQIIDENGNVVADAWTLAAMQDADKNGHWVTIAEGGESGPAWVSNPPTQAVDTGASTNVDLSAIAAGPASAQNAKILDLLTRIAAKLGA